jgi:hypothetical protein
MSKEFQVKKFEAHEFRIAPYPIEPPKDWEPSKNFPFCCDFHKDVVKKTEEFIEVCKKDKYIFQTNSDLTYLVKKITYQLSYCEEIISQFKDDEDWFLAITDYFEYSILSFGHPGYGNNQFISFLKHYIQNTKAKIDIRKRKKLVEWLENCINPKVNYKSADLNVLNDIYQKWIGTFPFELTYFHEIKEQLLNKKPFVSEVLNTNRYNGFTTFKVHTEESMVQYLFSLTKSILLSVNSVVLAKKVPIKDLYHRQIDLICSEREVKNKALLKSYNLKEREYIVTIQQWLQDEIAFFDQLKKLENDYTEKPTDSLSNFDLSSIFPEPETFMEKDIQKIEAYLDSWVHQSVDLNLWLEFKNIDFLTYIDELELSEEELEEIHNLQYKLFKAAVKNVVDNLISKVERLSDEKKKTNLITLHKTTLTDFFHHGNFSIGTLTNLSCIRPIRSDDNYLSDVLKAFAEITQMYFDSKNFLLAVPGTFLEHPFFYADVMYDYLNFLENGNINNEKNSIANPPQSIPTLKKNKKKPLQKTISFKVKKDKIELVKNLIRVLHKEIHLVNEEKCTIEDFIEILTSTHIDHQKEIHFACYNNQIAYIIDNLRRAKLFDNLTFASFVNSQIFHSRNLNLLKGNILSSSLEQNPNFASKHDIDNIFEKKSRIH